MKVKFSIQERKNLKSLIENPQMSGGVSLGEIKAMLALTDKLEYKGTQKDDTIDTELTLEDSEILKLHKVANNFSGWPVSKWVADLHDKLQEYKKKAEA